MYIFDKIQFLQFHSISDTMSCTPKWMETTFEHPPPHGQCPSCEDSRSVWSPCCSPLNLPMDYRMCGCRSTAYECWKAHLELSSFHCLCPILIMRSAIIRPAHGKESTSTNGVAALCDSQRPIVPTSCFTITRHTATTIDSLHLIWIRHQVFLCDFKWMCVFRMRHIETKHKCVHVQTRWTFRRMKQGLNTVRYEKHFVTWSEYAAYG